MVEYFPFLITLFIPIIIFQIWRLHVGLLKIKKADEAISKRLSEIKYLCFLISDAVNQKRSVQDCFNLYLDRLKEIVGWDYHSMFILDDVTQTIKIRFTGYLPPWYMELLSKKVIVKVGDASAGRAAAIKQPVTINAALNDPRFKSVSPIANQIDYKSLTCCPVLGKLKVYGSFCAYSKILNVFKSHDAQFLLTCGQYFGAIIENKLISLYLGNK